MQRVLVSSQRGAVHKLGDSQMSFSPKFRLAAAAPSSLFDTSMELELSVKGEPLIPGLPDDIAVNCLLQFPVETHLSCRAVCKRWHFFFRTKEVFFTRRKELGFKDPWLFVYAFHKCTGKIHWKVLDLRHFTWHEVPPMPCKDNVCFNGSGIVSMPEESTLFVFGGVGYDMEYSLDLVVKYEMDRNRWTVQHRMTPRSFFASAAINGKIYVAGGYSQNLFDLQSTEVLDPVDGYWESCFGMDATMVPYDSAVLNGKLLMTSGWVSPFEPRGEVFDAKYNDWEPMAVGLCKGWTGSSVVVYGRLFVVSEPEGMKLKVYDPDTDSWEMIDGPALPEQICKPFALNSHGSRIYVVGRNLHVAVGNISTMKKMGSKNGEGEKLGFSVGWEVVESPEIHSSMTPSSSQILFA